MRVEKSAGSGTVGSTRAEELLRYALRIELIQSDVNASVCQTPLNTWFINSPLSLCAVTRLLIWEPRLRVSSVLENGAASEGVVLCIAERTRPLLSNLTLDSRVTKLG